MPIRHVVRWNTVLVRPVPIPTLYVCMSTLLEKSLLLVVFRTVLHCLQIYTCHSAPLKIKTFESVSTLCKTSCSDFQSFGLFDTSMMHILTCYSSTLSLYALLLLFSGISDHTSREWWSLFTRGSAHAPLGYAFLFSPYWAIFSSALLRDYGILSSSTDSLYVSNPS